MNVFRSTPCGAGRATSCCRPGAEHEQEQQRLDERGDDPHAVAAEADELAPPDDLDRAQLAAPAARRDADADDLGRAAPVATACSVALIAGPVIICIITRLACSLPDSSASRIVVPV